MDEFRRPREGELGEEDLTEAWASAFRDAPPEAPAKGEPASQAPAEVNWDDYSFNFDSEFGDWPAQPAPTPVPEPQPAPAPKPGGFSVDAMRRLHEGGASYGTPAAVSLPPETTPPSPPDENPPRKPPRRRKRRRRPLKIILWLLGGLLLALLLTAAALWFFAKQPKTDRPIGERKKGCSAILLAGTDEEGYRTDTLLLLYLDQPGRQMRLLSIPRDTMVNRDNPVPKINGAYGANGATKDGFDERRGMEFLMDYVQDLVGYRPDGYVLLDLDCFEELVDRMGGVDFDVPMDMRYEDPAQDLAIDLSAGEQHLSGREAMWLVRFRSGYAMADLERVNVQRSFLSAAASQWCKPGKLFRLPGALRLLRQNALTDLSRMELLWIVKSVVLCRKNFESDTLPGEPKTVNGGAYYVEDTARAAALINERYNPYQTEITEDMLHPYGK